MAREFGGTEAAAIVPLYIPPNPDQTTSQGDIMNQPQWIGRTLGLGTCLGLAGALSAQPNPADPAIGANPPNVQPGGPGGGQGGPGGGRGGRGGRGGGFGNMTPEQQQQMQQ